ncbi:MAG: hypothetical protein MZV65_35200 [Chromatiales bacterium]|nr:hypothetical protein [Chromatiales bacterium]
MPEMDGLELARQIRADSTLAATQAGATVLQWPDDRTRRRQAGMQGHAAQTGAPGRTV